ncbi:hypothetical protein QLQ12_45860 [Actinoplanes sp. NEAU-A12]|uniref:Uncharacterized protein n=1 Tax=Actinoplanes sandaracinus TaxID=3045177 RepID=A0ABT6X259_9ACTN|nr:hypothetical protein [Actinoplanes sandaracinus]MDI6105921.1 hypothetical protein [Actinoplanes sandaracinus]
MIARQQLERWTENLAHNTRTAHRQGETRAEFIQRVWDVELNLGARRNKTTRGRMDIPSSLWSGRRAGAVFIELSELMHGRGPLVEAAHWDAAHLLKASDNPESSRAVQRAYSLISEAIAMIVRRIRVCIRSLATEIGMPSAGRLVAAPEMISPGGSIPPQPWSLWPLVPTTGLSPEIQARFSTARNDYRAVNQGERPAGRLFRDDEFIDLHFYAARARSAESALEAFEEERTILGDAFNLDSMLGREFQYVIPSEIAGIAALWNRGTPVGEAAATASTAIRSAYWLWLEDDDRAMGLLRVILEQVARLRSWRLKEDKARSLEVNPDATPRDWLELAGLRRLGAFNWALGEMAHFRNKTDWPAAREMLIQFQPDYDAKRFPELTGRGWALDQAAFLLFREATEIVGLSSPKLKISLTKIYEHGSKTMLESERQLNTVMDKVWMLRRERYSVAPFTGPAVEHARLWSLFGKGTESPLSAESALFHSLALNPVDEEETVEGNTRDPKGANMDASD